MKRKWGQILVVGLVICFTLVSFAQDETPKKEERADIFIYKPPMRGAPANRMGGGTRGIGDDLPVIEVLVPNHTALTTETQPTLFWYISKPTSKRIIFTMNDEDAGKTLFQTLLKIEKRGIQRINLSDYELNLLPEKEYSWFVTIIVDPKQPSKDILASGNIRYVKASEALSEKLSKAEKNNKPAIFAEQGIWYDAFASLSELIEENPTHKLFRKQRAALLEQINLDDVAKFELTGE